MKSAFSSLLIVMATMVISSAYAQAPERGQRTPRQQFSAEDMAKMQTEQIAQTLKLTDAQVQAIYELNLANAIEQIKQMEQQRKLQQAREVALDEGMKKILDESQYKKWSKQKRQQQQNFMNRSMGGPGSMGRGGMNGGFGGDPSGFGGQGGFGGGFDNGMGF